MLSPTKEKGSGFGNKLHKIQNMLHHRPRSGSFGHKEKDKTEKNNNRKYIKYYFYFSICSCISFLYSPMITFFQRMPPCVDRQFVWFLWSSTFSSFYGNISVVCLQHPTFSISEKKNITTLISNSVISIRYMYTFDIYERYSIPTDESHDYRLDQVFPSRSTFLPEHVYIYHAYSRHFNLCVQYYLYL